MNSPVVHVINSILVALGVAFLAYLIAPVRHGGYDEPLFGAIAIVIGSFAGIHWYRTHTPTAGLLSRPATASTAATT